jgi:cytochrome oxidase Cu insertion factor (SCO1/SenC/PrrC family)
VQFTNAKMLQPNPAEFPAFLQLFQLRVGKDDKGDLIHKTDLFLVDRQGRLIYWYKGMWDDKQVMEHLKKAAAE